MSKVDELKKRKSRDFPREEFTELVRWLSRKGSGEMGHRDLR